MSKNFFLSADIKDTSKANIQKLFSVFDVPLGLSLTMLELVPWHGELYILWGRSLSAGSTHKFIFLVQQGWCITLVDRCHLSEIIGGCQDFKYLTAHLMLVNILGTDFSFKILIWIFDITLA